MTLRKKIFLSLACIPFILFIIVLVRPVSEGDQHNGIELLFLVLGLPILLVNYLEWSDPQFMDGIFGKSILSQSQGLRLVPAENAPAQVIPARLPTWTVFVVLACVLVLGIGMGAGALFVINQLKPAPATVETSINPDQPGVGVASLSPALTGTPESATLTETVTPLAIRSTPTIPSFTPTLQTSASIPPVSATPTATKLVTPNANRCVSPSAIELAAILAGIKLLGSTNELKTEYVVKSSAADQLWFFAAKVYGPDLEGGVSAEPAVWSFYEKDGTPYNIYSTNDTAFQYSDFSWGPDASPPLNMEVDGAQKAYECAVNGN